MPTFRVYPVADGAQTGIWAASGPLLYAQLDDDPPDDDLTWIEGGGDSTQSRTQKFLCSVVDLPDSVIVTLVQGHARAERRTLGSNVSTFQARLYLDLNGIRYQIAALEIDDTGIYHDVSYSSATSPATGIAWTAAEVTRFAAVVEIAQAFDNFPRVGGIGRFTQLYFDISFISPTWTIRRDGVGGRR